MSLNLNHVTLAGNLTRDPQIRFLANQQAVANFGLAINRRWKADNGEQREETTFVDCEVWGRQAELAGQYLHKGSPIYLEGRLKLETWEKDGTKHSKLRVVAQTIQYLGTKPKTEAAASAAAPVPAASTPAPAAGPPKPTDDGEPPF